MLPKYLLKLVMDIPDKEILAICKQINSEYNTFLRDFEIWSLLLNSFPLIKHSQIYKLQPKVSGHKVVNYLLNAYYPSERVIKSKVISNYIEKKNEVSVFEFVVNSSRADICRINGNSYAYEIKTQFDTLEKLNKQVDDYLQAFEFVFLIIHEKFINNKELNSLPDAVGVISYKYDNGECTFDHIKQAEYSDRLNNTVQFNCYSSADLDYALKSLFNVKPLKSKAEKQDQFLEQIKVQEIDENDLFKLIIKNKYQDNWKSLKKVYKKIEPIDYQAFYQSTHLCPSRIYYKSESIVLR